jgi:hypothetical protein
MSNAYARRRAALYFVVVTPDGRQMVGGARCRAARGGRSEDDLRAAQDVLPAGGARDVASAPRRCFVRLHRDGA